MNLFKFNVYTCISSAGRPHSDGINAPQADAVQVFLEKRRPPSDGASNQTN